MQSSRAAGGNGARTALTGNPPDVENEYFPFCRKDESVYHAHCFVVGIAHHKMRPESKKVGSAHPTDFAFTKVPELRAKPALDKKIAELNIYESNDRA